LRVPVLLIFDEMPLLTKIADEELSGYWVEILFN
jgi:hypothetical protein